MQKNLSLFMFFTFIACITTQIVVANQARLDSASGTRGTSGLFFDADEDGDIDLDDYASFAECLAGPDSVPQNNDCLSHHDADSDGDVDLKDFTLFQRVFLYQSPPQGMVLIPTGEFHMGDTFNEGDWDEVPVHAVYVDAFYMSQYEVTNAEYVEALNWAYTHGRITVNNDGRVSDVGTSIVYCKITSSMSSNRIIWNGSIFSVVAGKENHPMMMVSWYGSAAYCNWRSEMEGRPTCYDLSTWVCTFDAGGYRLPTEAEWEKAARGGIAERRFPWSDSDEIQHARANYLSSSDYTYDTSPTRGFHPTFYVGSRPYTSPVGYFASNDFGLFDMAGNMREWCNDWWIGSYYGSSPYDNPEGPGPSYVPFRVNRGGCSSYEAFHCRSAMRFWDYPETIAISIGFRVILTSDSK